MRDLLIAAAVLGYGVWAYLHPYRDCPSCKGSGTNPLSTKRRSGRCRRCKGTRQVRTVGAALLHKAVRSLIDHAKGRKP